MEALMPKDLNTMTEEQQLGEEIRTWMQQMLDTDANPAMLASLLTLNATKLGLELGYDPRLVMVNGLNSMSAALNVDLDKEFSDLGYSEDYNGEATHLVHSHKEDADQQTSESEGFNVSTDRLLH
jgi:hypothetical protein